MKKILSAMLAAAMLLCAVVTVSADDSPFSDVKTSRWSYKSIVYAYENGLMDGIGGGKFDPSGTMTRGMVVTVLYRMEDKPNVEFENAFTDVKAGKYYSDAVIWAKNNNIVNGVSEGKFDPGGKITREQLATMLYRYAEFKGLDTRVKGDLSKFPDADKVHSYAKNALTWATDKGLITGVKSGNKDMLDPRGNATREQFATILQRFKNTDLSAPLEWNSPVLLNDYTEPEYPLVTDADVYVAVDGDDSGPGTFDAPVATFARAAERVAEIKADPAWEPRDLTVAFKAGDYGALQYTLTDESGGGDGYRVTYCKYGDGDVIFSGGTVLREEEFEEITAEEATIFKSDAAADIKKIRVDGISASSKIFGEDGVLHTARFPNMFDDGTDNLFSGSGYPSDENHFTMIPIFTRKLASYHTLEGVKLYGYLTTGWHKDLLTVGGVDKNTNEVYIPHPEEAIMGSLRYGVFPW